MSALCDVGDLVHESLSQSYSLAVAAKTISELRHFPMTLDSDTPHLTDAIDAITRSELDPVIAEAIAVNAMAETNPEIILQAAFDDELNGAVGF